MLRDLCELVPVRPAVKPVVPTVGVDDDVAVRLLVTHTLGCQRRCVVGGNMSNDSFDSKIAKDSLRVPTVSRQDEEDNVAGICIRSEIIPANAPRRWVSPVVRIVVNPGAALPAGRSIHSLKR